MSKTQENHPLSGGVGALLDRCRAAGLSLEVDGDALHIDFELDPPGELIEELRRRKPEVMAVLAGATVIAPAQWFEKDPVGDEPPYDQPYLARRGVIRCSAGRFEHFCVVCGAWGGFGFEVTAEEPGHWYCFRHRPGGIEPQ
jgi:hypothetical protein